MSASPSPSPSKPKTASASGSHHREALRFRSATIASVQSLGRALRETLRLRRLRKVKQRQNQASVAMQRRRSKSVGAAGQEDIDPNEISEVGISAVVASDYGPRTGEDQSKSFDRVELAGIREHVGRSEHTTGSDSKLATNKAQKMKKAQSEGEASSGRRRSKDDHDLPAKLAASGSSAAPEQQPKTKKRFGKLFGSLRLKPPSHSHLAPETPATTPTSSD